MAINYAAKHAQEIDERFSAAAITEPAVNKDYEFVGVKTVVVHSVPVVAMHDYQRSGLNRYGTPEELSDETQELTMSQDKAFTFTVDKGNEADDPALNAGKALNRQIAEVIAPMVDRYRLGVMVSRAGGAAYGATTKANAYETFLDLNGMLNDANAPVEGRLAYASTSYFKLLKQDSSFIRSGDLPQSMLISGQLGEVDGVRTIEYLDLTSTDIFNSPAFYLQQNDVVYVKPNKYKAQTGEISQNRNFYLSLVGTAISVATLIVTLTK